MDFLEEIQWSPDMYRHGWNWAYISNPLYFLFYLVPPHPGIIASWWFHLCFIPRKLCTPQGRETVSFTSPAPCTLYSGTEKFHGCPLTWIKCSWQWNCCMAFQGPLQLRWSWAMHMMVECWGSPSLYSPFWEVSDTSSLLRQKSRLLTAPVLFPGFQEVAALS